MPDTLYREDFVLWSQRQAALLAQLRAGERVNEIDWDNLIEEVEGLGISETRAVRTLLRRALEHLLKAAGWPGSRHVSHWQHETRAFLTDARDGWAPSLGQLIDLPKLYGRALETIRLMRVGKKPPAPLPDSCPFTLPELLPADESLPDIAALVARLRRRGA